MEEGAKSEFNSSLDYLSRLSGLTRAYHYACAEFDAERMFVAVDGLYSELDPRMCKAELMLHYNLRVKASNALKSGNTESIRNWFLHLNRFAHDQGLVVINKDTMPGVIRG